MSVDVCVELIRIVCFKVILLIDGYINNKRVMFLLKVFFMSVVGKVANV